jgi:hypothetical protein
MYVCSIDVTYVSVQGFACAFIVLLHQLLIDGTTSATEYDRLLTEHFLLGTTRGDDFDLPSRPQHERVDTEIGCPSLSKRNWVMWTGHVNIIPLMSDTYPKGTTFP